MSTLTMYDRVQETTTTSGNGTVSLLGATTGYASFASTVGDGNQTYYVIADQSGSNWEVGIGTYTASGSTLSRTTVLASSNSGSLVSFGTNLKNVFVTCPASILSEIATPAGSAGQIQFNNAGAFGGVTAVGVANGGTGDTSLTAYAVLCGGTTSTGVVQSVASLGTSGYVLTSNGAGALPTFQTSSSSNATLLFAGTSSVTVANTTSATNLLSSGNGSLTLPGVAVGRSYTLQVRGFWSSLAATAGNLTIALVCNSTTYATTGAFAVPLSLSNDFWSVDLDIQFISTSGGGQAWILGRFVGESGALGATIAGMVNTSTQAAGSNMTANALTLVATWSVASASNTITQAVVLLNQTH